jgi:cell division septum initiation protein DivIVA
MTEKRFYISGIGISDRERKRLYDLKTVDGFISVRDLLNELSDENEQLKSELKALRKKYNDFSDAVDKRLQEMDKRLFE